MACDQGFGSQTGWAWWAGTWPSPSWTSSPAPLQSPAAWSGAQYGWRKDKHVPVSEKLTIGKNIFLEYHYANFSGRSEPLGIPEFCNAESKFKFPKKWVLYTGSSSAMQNLSLNSPRNRFCVETGNTGWNWVTTSECTDAKSQIRHSTLSAEPDVP